MSKKKWYMKITISAFIALSAVAVSILLCTSLYFKYTPPNDENTCISRGTVVDVYHGVPGGIVGVVLEGGEELRFVYPWRIQGLYSAIGYDVDALADLLEGKTVEICRMEKLPWIISISVDDTVIDNKDLTNDKCVTDRIAIAILEMIALALAVCGEIAYLQEIHKKHKKAEKKRLRKESRTPNI